MPGSSKQVLNGKVGIGNSGGNHRALHGTGCFHLGHRVGGGGKRDED